MKKIIMICNHFAPDNTIAAVRITKFAEYFKKHGYEVTVFAEKKEDGTEDEILKKNAEGIKTVRSGNSETAKKRIAFYKKMISPVKQKRYDDLSSRMKINRKTGKYEFYPFETAHPLIGSLDYLVEMYRQYDLYRMSKAYLKTIKNPAYIFTSYGDYFGIFAGAYLHRKHKNIPWIVDIRDAVCRYKFTPDYVRWGAKLIEKYIYREADCITAVSKGICRAVPRRYWKKVHCVTNGYDRRDREGIAVSRHKEYMTFAYTGAMYGGTRNLSPFFRTVRELAEDGLMDCSGIRFQFAGKESAYEIFESQARKYGLENQCIYCGCLPRKESLKLQMEADVLLVSSFDYKTDVGGIITGKALEYMSADKPVIAVINGDIEDSELAQIIRSADLGFAYEESHEGEDRRKLYLYVKKIYQEYEQTGKISHSPDKKVMAGFDYRYLGRRMMKMIETLD